MRQNPAVVEQWVRIFRDLLIALTATFMLVYATVWQRPPNEFVIGGALALFGLIPAIRYDSHRREKEGTDGD